jgi:transposase
MRPAANSTAFSVNPGAEPASYPQISQTRQILKESLERLWTYRYEGAMLRYLQSWIDQLRWQRLVPFQKLAFMLLDHLDGILNYCRTKVRFGVVEAINGNIKTLLRRGRGYKNLGYLLLKAQRMAVTKTEFIVLQKAA